MLKTLLGRSCWFVHVASLLQLRASAPLFARRPLLLFEGRTYTYAEVQRQAAEFAHLFVQRRAQRIAAGRHPRSAPLAVGIYQENTPEFVFAVLGAAQCGAVVFGLNTGLRGETLARVVAQAGLGLLMTESRLLPALEQAREAADLEAADLLVVDSEPPAQPAGVRTIAQALDELRPKVGRGFGQPPRVPIDTLAPWLVIYTSGTTGAPKGVVCSQLKLVGAGLLTWLRIHLRPSDRGYVCLPLFHSNAWFVGILPLLVAGGSFVLRRRFSASAFEGDILADGVSYLNYVGQPIHYIVQALESAYGSGEAVTRALAGHRSNRLRLAHGNGATPIDRQKLVRYLGMEHVYELYGSTEAAITTVVRPGDPLDSVGQVRSRRNLILDEQGRECPPAEVDDAGRITNYRAAVGEISRRMGTDNLFFDGYWGNERATSGKFRDGYYRSGDLGHTRVIRGRRYLYFDGRKDDWIRKDGENFSAENVAQAIANDSEVETVVAYGAPCEVADEKVMVAMQLVPGARFDPQAALARYQEQAQAGQMDPKWVPDFIRIVEGFEITETQKILIAPLKRRHFRLDRSTEPIYFRRRGDDAYRELTQEEYETLVASFERNGRGHLLGE